MIRFGKVVLPCGLLRFCRTWQNLTRSLNMLTPMWVNWCANIKLGFDFIERMPHTKSIHIRRDGKHSTNTAHTHQTHKQRDACHCAYKLNKSCMPNLHVMLNCGLLWLSRQSVVALAPHFNSNNNNNHSTHINTTHTNSIQFSENVSLLMIAC